MWRERLREVEAQHAELTQRLSDPAVLAFLQKASEN